MRSACQPMRAASSAHCSADSGNAVSHSNGTSGSSPPAARASTPRTRRSPPAARRRRTACRSASRRRPCGASSAGFGWTMRTTSASDGSLPVAACISAAHRRPLQPALDQPLRPRAERRPPDRARAHDLHEVAQHAAVVDHALEHRHRKVRIGDASAGGQQRRHVLHRAARAGIDRRLGHEERIDSRGPRRARRPSCVSAPA